MHRPTVAALVHRPAVTALVLAFAVATSRAQESLPYQTLLGPDHIGWDVAFTGDADGDGLDDVLIGSPSDGSAGPQIGAAFLASGADGSLLQSFFGATANGAFGLSVGAIGDIDSDGRPDVVVGGPNEGGKGSATAFSGQSGALLFQWFGDSTSDGLGTAVAGAGDVNADGVPDVIAGAPYDDDFGPDCGMVRVYSGADGSILYTWYGRTAGERLGISVAGPGDLDGDGHADVLAASSPLDPAGSGLYGRAVVFSGKTGNVLRQVQSNTLGDGYGADLAALGDVDADGTNDFAVTSPLAVTRVRVYSGSDGSILYKHFTATAAHDVSAAGDRDGDGHADYALADTGAVRVYSGFDRSLLWEFYMPSKFDYPFAISALGELNGDGKPDLVAGIHTGFSTADRVYTYLGGCEQVESYCVAGTSASGCSATLGATGVASASAPTGFLVQAAGVEGQKDGLFFFGTSGRQAAPWGNGTSLQCVVPPVSRGPLLAGTGTAGTCSGALGLDLNARWTAQPSQRPAAGALMQVQLWYRDPANTSNQTTSLSDAIEVTICP